MLILYSGIGNRNELLISAEIAGMKAALPVRDER